MSVWIEKLTAKKTNFQAGYLKLKDIPLSASNTLSAPQKFVAPRKLDFRDMCIATSNQGTTPHCAGYSTAGFIEIQNWRKKHYPEQVDGDRVYKKAKEYDSYEGDGTTLDCAVKAALELGLIKGKEKFISRSKSAVQFAIHEFSACIAGFLITDEWNYCHKNGRISNFKDKARDLGGHAVLICGYDPYGPFIQNSWGTSWGLHGFCHLSWKQFKKQFMSGVCIVDK